MTDTDLQPFRELASGLQHLSLHLLAEGRHQ